MKKLLFTFALAIVVSTGAQAAITFVEDEDMEGVTDGTFHDGYTIITQPGGSGPTAGTQSASFPVGLDDTYAIAPTTDNVPVPMYFDAWFNVHATPSSTDQASYHGFQFKDRDVGGQAMMDLSMQVNSGVISFELRDQTTWTPGQSSTDIQVGDWHRITLRFDTTPETNVVEFWFDEVQQYHGTSDTLWQMYNNSADEIDAFRGFTHGNATSSALCMDDLNFTTRMPAFIPEPATLAMLGLGAATLLLRFRRRR